MEKYMLEIDKLQKIIDALYDAKTVAERCEDDESAGIYLEAMVAAENMRADRIQRIRRITDQDAGNLLFRRYVECAEPKTIMRENKWNTSTYKSKLRAALQAYKVKMQV